SAPAGRMHAAGAVLGRHDLRPRRLPVELDPPEARQQIGRLPEHQMAAIELGGDLDGQLHLPPRRLYPLAVGNGADEVAAESDEGMDVTGDDALAHGHRGEPLRPRRLEAELLGHLIERRALRLFGDPDGALPLNVGVTADGADPGTFPADVPPQQKQVYHHLHVLHAETVLGETHAVDADDALAAHVNRSRRLHAVAAQPGLVLQRSPVRAPAAIRKLLEAG